MATNHVPHQVDTASLAECEMDSVLQAIKEFALERLTEVRDQLQDGGTIRAATAHRQFRDALEELRHIRDQYVDAICADAERMQHYALVLLAASDFADALHASPQRAAAARITLDRFAAEVAQVASMAANQSWSHDQVPGLLYHDLRMALIRAYDDGRLRPPVEGPPDPSQPAADGHPSGDPLALHGLELLAAARSLLESVARDGHVPVAALPELQRLRDVVARAEGNETAR